MSLFALVLDNVLRRPTRSLLTVIGVAVGIGAVVILLSLAWGFERSWSAAYAASGADLLVGKVSLGRPLPWPFPGSTAAELRKLPEVQDASGVLTELLSIEDAPAVIVFGWEPKSFLWNHLTLLEGRWPRDDDEHAVALGTVSADMLAKRVGDVVQIETNEYLVCGRFTSSSFSENGAVVMALGQLQSISAHEGQVNFVTLKLKSDAGQGALDDVRAEVHSRYSGFSAETSGEVVGRNVAIQAAKAMSLATSLVALVIGGLGITNTVLMSVMERRREIAVLMALGWRRARVIKVIVIESSLLSAVGGLIGAGTGFVMLRALQEAPWFRGKIETDASVWLLAAAMILSLCLGGLCGLYPAWWASRVSVVEGLRHE
jgi:putative ABC transport system permease protein